MPIVALVLVISLPLLSFLLLGLAGRRVLGTASGYLATLLQFISMGAALYAAWFYFFKVGKINDDYQSFLVVNTEWLRFSDTLSIDMGILIDPISAMMLVVVTFVSAMVHLYSTAYMKGDQRMPVFFSFLGLFTFSMLGLVVATNLFQMYIFWELVGVSSFLLIGYYYDKPSAVAACKKAFIVTRFADLGFLIGILILSYYGGTFDFALLINNLTDGDSPALQSIAGASFIGLSALTWGLLLVFIGGAGKSAMFPLHIWLPDAMEGPTPVSALIHAATMVVAGVFLVARLFPIYAIPGFKVLELIAYVGAFSAFFAAVIACTQTDIKRILAYSTMSQIGFMLFSLGVAHYGGEWGLGYTASMFHLFTHAMFKALLFLGAGAVIHYVHSNEMTEMGGLRKLLPVTHACFLIACLAIAGIPPFAGFFSKEEILLAAYQNNKIVYYVALATSLLTAFYMFRLYFSIFWNKPKQTQLDHHHGEGGSALMTPLVILAIAAASAGFIPFGSFVSSNGRELKTELHLGFSVLPVALGITGILLAAWLYQKENSRPAKLASSLGLLYRSAKRKFFVDEVYQFITHKIIFNIIGKTAAWVDKNIVDGMVNAAGTATQTIAIAIKQMQSGRVQQYAIYFLVGTLVLCFLFLYVWR